MRSPALEPRPRTTPDGRRCEQLIDPEGGAEDAPGRDLVPVAQRRRHVERILEGVAGSESV